MPQAYNLMQTTWTTPLMQEGGKEKMWQLFGEQMDEIINELNEALAA